MLKTACPVLALICLWMLADTAYAELAPGYLEKLQKRNFEVVQQVDRIQNFRINGWNSLDLKAVIFNAGASSDYLITLRRSCDGLRSSNTIAFSTTVSNITTKDHLVVRGTGGIYERCLIREMYELRRIPKDERESRDG